MRRCSIECRESGTRPELIRSAGGGAAGRALGRRERGRWSSATISAAARAICSQFCDRKRHFPAARQIEVPPTRLPGRPPRPRALAFEERIRRLPRHHGDYRRRLAARHWRSARRDSPARDLTVARRAHGKDPRGRIVARRPVPRRKAPPPVSPLVSGSVTGYRESAHLPPQASVCPRNRRAGAGGLRRGLRFSSGRGMAVGMAVVRENRRGAAGMVTDVMLPRARRRPPAPGRRLSRRLRERPSYSFPWSLGSSRDPTFPSRSRISSSSVRLIETKSASSAIRNVCAPMTSRIAATMSDWTCPAGFGPK